MDDSHHAIRMVARRTGLTAHVIRIWEKRYEAVQPDRTDTNRRLYSEHQIQRLGLLRDLTHAGHSIGHVAKLPTEKLRELAAESPAMSRQASRPLKVTAATHTYLDECLSAVKALDSRALEDTLKRGATELGTQGLLQRVIAPLSQNMGELWRDGIITAAHEHFASSVIRVFLGQAARAFEGADHAPGLVVTTPAGQIHELGALIVSAAAANLGWHVIYLGASLPAAEIAGAVRQNRARALALSLVYPEDDPRLEGELTRLRELLPTEVTLLAGGRAMPAYRDVLVKIGAVPLTDLAQLGAALDDLRKPAKKIKP